MIDAALGKDGFKQREIETCMSYVEKPLTGFFLARKFFDRSSKTGIPTRQSITTLTTPVLDHAILSTKNYLNFEQSDRFVTVKQTTLKSSAS